MTLQALLRHGQAVGPQGARVRGHVVADALGSPAVVAALAGGGLAWMRMRPDMSAPLRCPGPVIGPPV